VRYDLKSIEKSLNPKKIYTRTNDLWRYREILPVRDAKNIVSLGEGLTPLLHLRRIGKELSMKSLYLKNEGMLPTGTFKDRGAAVGISRAKELGIKTLAMPTNGNAGGAWAAYAAAAGIRVVIVMPKDAPFINRAEIHMAGADLYLVDGLISDAGKIVGQACADHGWFDVSTLKEPYRIEGKKTMGIELCEQFKWEVPDVILYPTGGGVGIIGIYKAILELREMGWIGAKTPRLVAVQSTGCAPIVRAWEEKQTESVFWQNAKTIAFGITVPKAIGDFLVLEAIYQSDGCAVSVNDEEILAAQRQLASKEGIFVCPEGAATLSAALRLKDSGWINKEESVVLLNTGTGLKYPETVIVNLPLLKIEDRL
jgi:threonine synthase